jgi:glycerol-3-phosphate dehydrogenase
LCVNASRYFQRAVRPEDVVWSYSGVRPLLDDAAGSAAAVTRDYALDVQRAGAPVLSVYGGKITTFRVLAEEAVNQLAALLGRRAPAWTAQTHLPGAVFPGGDFAAWLAALQVQHPHLDAALLRRLAHAYGRRIEAWLADDGLAAQVLPGLPTVELRYLVEQEWAMSAEDVLWRRSKLGLHLPGAAPRLAQCLAERAGV